MVTQSSVETGFGQALLIDFNYESRGGVVSENDRRRLTMTLVAAALLVSLGPRPIPQRRGQAS